MGSELVSIQVVTFNSEKYIFDCITSILMQTYSNIEIIVIDNNSVDNTISIVEKNYPQVKIIKNKYNLGFCGGHNIGFGEIKGKYVVVLNPDVTMDCEFVENAVKLFQKNNILGMVSGKLIRLQNGMNNLKELDTTGVDISKQRRGKDRGQSEEDMRQYDHQADVFGVSGAAAVYKSEMLEDIKLDDEYFDENFFAYKEDIDLSWRARLKGWECAYCPEAIGYHARGWKEGKRKDQPLFIRIHSIKNRILMMIKNDSLKGFIKHLPYILIYELAVFIYCLFLDFRALKYISEIFRCLPSTLEKRRIIQSTRTVSDQEIYKYFK